MDNTWHEGVERVISRPLLFKSKLGIGDDAYKSLSTANKLKEYWDLIGAAGTGAFVAKSAFIANAFFQPTGLMAFLGLASASTPIGWVVFAAVASAGAWYGVDAYYKKARNNLVETIPKFINTPLDVIGVAIFNLMLPLSLKVAAADGLISKSEAELIRSYFVDEWGYDEDFYLAGYRLFLEDLDNHQTRDVAKRLSEFQKDNPDCNQDFMMKELSVFLQEIMDTDGTRDPNEVRTINEITNATKPKSTLLNKIDKALPRWSDRPKNPNESSKNSADINNTLSAHIQLLDDLKRTSTETTQELARLSEIVDARIPNTIRTLDTHERLLVALNIKTDKNVRAIDEYSSRIHHYESQIDGLTNNNHQLETQFALHRKYLYWLSILTVCSALTALASLLLIIA